MTVQIEYPEGSTPLDPNEVAGLIPKHITLQSELNDLEQVNILDAQKWLLRKKPKDLLNIAFTKDLHKRMFNKVWKWAGKYRQSGKNIGVNALDIEVQLFQLFKDTDYWIKHQSYNWIEIGARFHHRLVQIRAFPNGNGRHARMMTDAFLKVHQQPSFSWGATTYPESTISQTSLLRAAYLNSLKDADQGRFQKLVQFVQN